MKKFLIALLFLIPLSGNAQSAQRWYTALLPNPQGEDFVAVIPNASVFVCAYNDQDQCLTPQPIYSDTALTVPISQPLLADGNGVYSYYVQSGTQVVEKVCAPFDQCASYQVQIGDKINVGPGSGTVTSVSCDNLPPLFTCNVLNNTTSPLIEYTLDTAADLTVFSNFSGSTGAPGFNHLIAGTNIALTEGSGNLTISSTAPYPFFQTNGINNFNQTGLNLIAGGNVSLANSGFGVTISATAPYPFFQTNSVNNTLQTGLNLIAGTNVTLSNSGFGVTINAAGGGGGGNCEGSLPGDDTSTNCGFGNLTGNTSTDVETFGYLNANLAPSYQKAMFGAGNLNLGAELTINNPMIAVGYNNMTMNSPGIDPTSTKIYAFGNANFTGATSGDDPYFNNVTAIGDGNFCSGQFGNTTITDTFVFGENNDCYLVSGSMIQHNVISIGDTSLNPAHSTGTYTYNDLIFMGDTDGGLGHTGDDTSTDAIGIGDGTVFGYNMTNVVGIGFADAGVIGGSEVVGIGDTNAGTVSGHDAVAIGDENMPGGGGLTVIFSGHDAVAIGNHTLACLQSGSDNVGIGDYAGSIGYVNATTCGNSNKSGSNNVWIGNNAGPNTTTQLSNTIAIGMNAFNTVSNQTVIGNSSITSLKLFGCPSGQVTYDDGSGTCFTPSSSGGSSSIVASAEVVSFSATPTFSTSFNVSRIILTGNITSFTLGTGTDGQDKTLCFKQGSGPYTVAGPANVHGFFTVGSVNAGWNCQSYVYDNTDSIWLATNLGLVNE